MADVGSFARDRAPRILSDLPHDELTDCLHRVRIYAADASDGRSEVPAWTLGSTITSCITRYLTATGGDDPQPEPAAEVREEWAAWEDTHTDDPNDEAARARRVEDRADAEDYVTMPKARRRRIARRTVTRSRWVAVDINHEEAAPMADRETTATPAEVCSCPWPHDELARREWPHVPLSLARAYADEFVQTGRRP